MKPKWQSRYPVAAPLLAMLGITLGLSGIAVLIALIEAGVHKWSNVLTW